MLASGNVFNLVSSFLAPSNFWGNVTCFVNESLEINGFTVPLYFLWLRTQPRVKVDVRRLSQEAALLRQRGHRAAWQTTFFPGADSVVFCLSLSLHRVCGNSLRWSPTARPSAASSHPLAAHERVTPPKSPSRPSAPRAAPRVCQGFESKRRKLEMNRALCPRPCTPWESGRVFLCSESRSHRPSPCKAESVHARGEWPPGVTWGFPRLFNGTA